MKKITSTLLSAAFVASLMVPVSVGTAEPAMALSKKQYCHNKATKYANKKTNKKVLGNMLVGGVIGGVIGHALPGGKSSTAIGAGVGAGAGMIAGSSKWEKYYWNKYEDCMDS